MDSWSIEEVDCFLRAATPDDWQRCRVGLMNASLDRLIYREHADAGQPLGWSCRALLDYVADKQKCATLTTLQKYTMTEMEKAAKDGLADLGKPRSASERTALELRCISVQRLAIEAAGSSCP